MRASKPVVKGEVIGLGVLPGQAFSLDVGGDPLLEFVFPLGCIAFGANKAYIGEVMSSSFLPLVLLVMPVPPVALAWPDDRAVEVVLILATDAIEGNQLLVAFAVVELRDEVPKVELLSM